MLLQFLQDELQAFVEARFNISKAVFGIASRARDVALGLPAAARYTICSHLKVIYLKKRNLQKGVIECFRCF